MSERERRDPGPTMASVDGPVDEGASEAPVRKRRWGRRVFLALLAVLLVTTGAGAWLAETSRGHRVVLDGALARVRGELAGELTIDQIRSEGLLSGATLAGVRLDSEGGRPFLTADSITVRYSLLGLLRGRFTLAAVDVWGAVVTVARYPGEDSTNVRGLLADRGATPDSARAQRELSFRDVELHGATLRILSPLDGEAGPNTVTVAAPDGSGPLRYLGLEGLSAHVTDLTVRPGANDLLAGTVEAMSMDVHVLPEPVRISSARGRLTWGPEGIVLGDAVLELPASRATGSVRVGPTGVGGTWGLSLAVEADPLDLDDVRWLDPRLPRGSATGRATVEVGPAPARVVFDGAHFSLEGSSLDLDGVLRFGERISVEALEARASPLALAYLRPWMPVPASLRGWVSGHLTLDGSMEALGLDGRVTLVPAGDGEATTAEVTGTLHLGDDPGATDFRATLNPLAFSLLKVVVPGPALGGVGSGDLRLSGRASGGMRLALELSHEPTSVDASHLMARGSLRRTDEDWVVDVQGDLAPLSLTELSRYQPALGAAGRASGAVRVVGPLSALRLTADLDTDAGPLRLDGATDIRVPGRYYRLRADLDGFRAHRMVSRIPDRTTLSGTIAFEGRGTSPDSMRARASVTLGRASFGGLAIDTLVASLRVEEGVLQVDTLAGVVGGIRVDADGDLGLVAGREAEAHVRLAAEDVGGLRSVLMGDTVIAGDTLSALQRDVLRLRGIDPDDLPDTADVAAGGSLSAEATLRGWTGRLDVSGTAGLQDGRYGPSRIRAALIDVEATSLFSAEARYGVSVRGSGLHLFGRALDSLRVRVEGEGGGGDVAVEVTRTGHERYAAAGGFHLDSVGGSVRVDTATFRFDSLVWSLAAPARAAWAGSSLSVDSLELVRPGVDPMRLVASGTVSRTHAVDFDLEARGVHAELVARLLQAEDLGVEGHVDAELHVDGPAEGPVVVGSVHAVQGGFRGMRFEEVSASLDYVDRLASVSLQATDQGRRVLGVGGTVPVDLSLAKPLDASHLGDRVVPGDMNVRVVADSLSAATAFHGLSMLEDVEGTVSGEFRVRGPLDRPEPSGRLELEDARWTVEALGVRHSRVQGTLELHPDRTVDVRVSGSARGSADVTGTLVFEPLSDPRLDLDVDFKGFQAIDRRDVTGTISGTVNLGGTYHRPVLTGGLTVDQGVLFVDEFVRTAEVVDLTDPRILNVVDTTALLSARPLIADIRNPFLESLRVDVDLSAPRDSWLRSEDMNVEMGGELLVSYDRTDRDLVLVGELEATRGTYEVLGRQFEVQDGTVSFMGMPGINPVLDIRAESRVRRVGTDPLEVTANVGGTLTEPRVDLTSDEQGLAQSDLVSYLIFGRPSYQLATGQTALGVQGAGRSLVGAGVGAGVSYLSGTVMSRVGTALAQQWGLDYLSITQAGDFGILSEGATNPLAGTQVEVGQYVSDDVFVVVVLRPADQQTSGTSLFGGARLEWALTDDYVVEGFVEDRFLRGRPLGFADLGFRPDRVLGVFIYREWGY